MDTPLTVATTRLRNARARLLELDIAEREKTLRSTEDCWAHISRFGLAMKDVRISSMAERTIWMEEIEKQMNFSRELLEEKQCQN